MLTHAEGYEARNVHPMIRWAAFTGIALLIVRRFVYATFPNVLPSARWPRESWVTGTILTMAFEAFVIALLLGVPYSIYRFRLRRGETNGRDLMIDCGAAGTLYLAALLLL